MSAHHAERVRRTALTAAVLVAALAGCSAGGGPPAPGDPPGSPAATAAPSTPVTAPTPTPTPVELTEARAARVFAAVDVPAGLRTDIQCPPRTAKDRPLCASDDDTVAWSVARTFLGRELPRAAGLTEVVTLNLTAATSEQAAETSYRQRTAALQRYDGAYDIPVARQGNRSTPGERGHGTLTATTAGAWTGTDLRQDFVLVLDGSTSGRLAGGRQVLRRGAQVLDVTWTAAAGNRSAELADLPDRVVAALDRAG